MAKCVGIEPTLRGLESLVLPLHQHDVGMAGLEPAHLLVPNQVPFQLGHIPLYLRTQGGSRTHRLQFLRLTALPFAYSGLVFVPGLEPRSAV